MSTRFRPAPQRRSTGRAISIWLIALLVALVATVQIRSQAEVERSLVGIDTTSLAFLIDDLHRANDTLQSETADLQARKATLQSGTSGAADQVLTDEATRLRAIEGLASVPRPGGAIGHGPRGWADQVLTDEATRLRAIEGLAPVHGPGVVIVIDATGLTALDLQDAINNLAAGGAGATSVNGHRVVTGVAIEQTASGVAIDGVVVSSPWTIATIGDGNRLGGGPGLVTQ